MAKIYIDNAKYMEFIDDIATQMTEIAYHGNATIEIKSKTSEIKELNGSCVVFKDEAQDYYNEKYDEVETMLNKTLNINSNNELPNKN
tara:strand:- start:104 stop:367 length:264 start_codon:yes stop_codon:yes gene_type:complete